MHQAIAVCFMGLSGSGKDTQSLLLKEFLEHRDGQGSVLYVYTGEILREAIKKGTYVAGLIDTKVMKAGNKAPDFLAIWAWAENIVARYKKGQHVIFSSSPRTIDEARVIDDFSLFLEFQRVYPILLVIEKEEAFRRLKARGRADDTDQVIQNRLDYFQRLVQPAVDYFRSSSRNSLVEIDGNPTDIQKIHKEILKATNLV